MSYLHPLDAVPDRSHTARLSPEPQDPPPSPYLPLPISSLFIALTYTSSPLIVPLLSRALIASGSLNTYNTSLSSLLLLPSLHISLYTPRS
ncbi:uncharacterized protein K444DRAFT_623039 [Hyaloscypha bicolor E]|uniref:Uncharacterized protein n=1 Tax=Hyaloscypha bicolor E TaxID=1095630 RepID=A0A2J6SFG4_9HELO|nr:uncharacterized protein K444DRAFT_623039 [Hyaloscypha bicolor E]PMD49493.1 hypothetical protein K444DRAFT_623039 [Hyaloscypha bicolor E]